jgi:hypothetical protein
LIESLRKLERNGSLASRFPDGSTQIRGGPGSVGGIVARPRLSSGNVVQARPEEPAAETVRANSSVAERKTPSVGTNGLSRRSTAFGCRR